MTRTCSGILLLAALLLALLPAAGAEEPKETAAPLVPVLELPPLESGTLFEIPTDEKYPEELTPPQEEGYLYPEDGGDPTGYADPSITVNLGTGRIYGTDYLYARVKIASPTQLRALIAGRPASEQTVSGPGLAKRVQAVLAVNGDYCGGEDFKRGVLMRQEDMLRTKCDGETDVLVVDRAGDLRILKAALPEDVEAIEDQAVNIFTFGPALVIDGVRQEPEANRQHHSEDPAQRTAICQTGPLEYLIITSEGPGNENSAGLSMKQFTDLVASIPEVRTAYNLDGGTSSTLVFRRDGDNWQKINGLSNPKIRPLMDIIYFSSAWSE